MPAFITGARGHDFGRHTPLDLLSAIGQAGFACTQLAYTKAVEGVQSYADVTPPLVEATREAAARTGVQIAVYGTYVELSFVDEAKRKAEAAKVLGQIGNAKLLAAGCMGSETTPMAKQPGASRKDALESLLRSLGEIMPACEEAGVLFGIECVYHHAMNTPEATKMVLDTIASPNLRVICDLANYIGAENASLDAQRRIWDKVGSWYGDKICAVHFKGQAFRPDGSHYSTSLEDSAIDYAGGFAMLRQLPQASLPRHRLHGAVLSSLIFYPACVRLPPGQGVFYTIKKVPSSRHVRMDGTPTGKFSAESVRGHKAECAVRR